MEKYDHKKLEAKWQKKWGASSLYLADEKSKAKKTYLLVEFPYPSGDGLHVGHVRPYTALDVLARKRRMEGENVLYPIGWDAFGLPTENYAIKTGIHPKEVTKQNTDNFRKQIKSVGVSFDWSREINTTDPEYYKWTQWIFLQLYKEGLAYKDKMAINWCLSCKIGLANEEVIDGKCERCDGDTEKRDKEQWMLGITKYAERLDKDLDGVDYSERIKLGQRNWIGRSEGAEINFKIAKSKEVLSVFTTRPDTLFGATYMVVAPEHPFVLKMEEHIENKDEIRKYIQEASRKSDIERTAEGKEKTGAPLKGVKAINPANKEEIPIYVADYVLAHYGTGAIMAVPAHDERDYAFATKYKLPIVEVIGGGDVSKEAYVGDGVLVNSDEYNGMEVEKAKISIVKKIGAQAKTTFKLRDWIFSRQRYWGEPIPMVWCQIDGWVPVSEDDLPIELPEVDKYEPTESGESPLAAIKTWVNTECPKCSGPAKRETDTMPNWAGSSWYYLRYTDPENKKEFAGKKALKEWIPVDWYNGGMEHTTLHVLYSRFWHKFLFDKGFVPTSEPYSKRTSHGLILAQNGEKMSKSKGNVINPNDIVNSVGADTLRLYEMFMGPFEQAIPWSTDNMVGSRRFLERVWRAQEYISPKPINSDLEKLLHKTIKKVTEDIEEMKFNTAVSSLMVLMNKMDEVGAIPKEDYFIVLQLLAPFSPHITEELWHNLAQKKSIHSSTWPKHDPKKVLEEITTIVVQVNGKVRGSFEAEIDTPEKELLKRAISIEKVSAHIGAQNIAKTVYIPNKLINIVV